MSDLDLLRRIWTTQLAVKARDEQRDGEPSHYIPWACWGYSTGWLTKDYGPFVTLTGPTDDDYAAGQRLIDAGLLDGCMFGCRGDMKVTHDGLVALGVQFDPLEVDDGHRPTAVLVGMEATIEDDALDEWRASLDGSS